MKVEEEIIPEEQGLSGFNIASIIITLFLSVLLALISTYVALRISALPWPIIFSVVVSLSILKIIKRGKPSVHEINVAQAGGTIGGLIAAGIVFVIPAILFLNSIFGTNMPLPSYIDLVILALFGGSLGVSLSMPIRRVVIDEENLPFPSGLAGAEVIKSGDEGGLKAQVLIQFAALSAVYSVFVFLILPPTIDITLKIAGFVILISILPWMLAFGSGYILGPSAAVISWFGGAVIGWGIILPYLLKFNPFGLTGSPSDIYWGYVSLLRETGMGMVLGTGFAFLVIYAIPKAGKIFKPFMEVRFESPWYTRIPLYLSIASFFALMLIGIHPVLAFIGVIGAWFMSAVAGRITGETNIDPLEQFGLFIGLIALFFGGVLGISGNLYQSILITSFVAIAAATAGDIGHDFKGAQILGTKPIDIVKADLLATIAGAITAPAAFLFLYNINRENFFVVFTAVQSKIVGIALGGLTYPMYFALGFALGFLIELVNRLSFMRYGRTTPLNGMTFGIGLFLGWALAIPFAIGGLIRWIVDSKKPELTELGIVAAAGIMGGEGITYYILPLFLIYGWDVRLFGFTVILGSIAISLIAYWFWISKRG